jgi:hypothetical protein
MPVNLEKYLPYLDELEISREEKVEFIEALHLLVQMVMDVEDQERLA